MARHTRSIPTQAITGVLNSILGETKVTITRGVNRSKIDFPRVINNSGISDVSFTIPDYSRNLLLGTVRFYPHNINSRNVSISLNNEIWVLTNGFIGIKITFEENGQEVNGTFHADLRNMVLHILLPLMVINGKVSYNRTKVGVSFSCNNIDIEGVPGIVDDLLEGYVSGKIEQKVERSTARVFETVAMRNAIATAITGYITALLGEGIEITSAKITNNHLTITYNE